MLVRPLLLAVVVLGLLTACTDQAATPAPTSAVPTDPPKAAGIELGPTGPPAAPACSGVVIEAGSDPQEAIDANPGRTTFCFGKGLHRIKRPLQPAEGMTLASSEGAVLSGSVALSGWKRRGRAWVVRGVLPPPYELKGECEDDVTKPCQPAEQLFLNGSHLTRVMSRQQLRPGTFYGDYAANALYVADDPRGKPAELSRTRTAIELGVPNVTVTGLTVEHFASQPQDGALQAGPGWKVIANEVRWNHAVGIMVVQGDNAEISRNTVADNGQLGIGQYKSAGVRITQNLVTRNNTDGFWIADWESGGIKATRSSGEVSGNDIVANRGIGMWSDIAEYDRRIVANRIRDNAADGIRYEISYDGVIEGNVVERNGFGTRRGSGPSLWDGGGINVNTSAGVRVTGNLVAGNRNGISIQSRTRGDGPRGRYLLTDVVVEGNQIAMDSATASTGVVENTESPTRDGSVVFRRNHYRLSPGQRFQYKGENLTWPEWQSKGFDQDSRSG